MTNTAQPRATVPEKGIRPGYNTTGLDIAKGVYVTLKPAGSENPNEIQLPAAGGKVFGVTMGIIKSGNIGDIQVEGTAVVLCGAGGLAVDQDVAATVAGAGVLAVSTNHVVGKCQAKGAAGEYAEVTLVGPAQNAGVVP